MNAGLEVEVECHKAACEWPRSFACAKYQIETVYFFLAQSSGK